jgi:preprotein translocase subunit SecG
LGKFYSEFFNMGLFDFLIVVQGIIAASLVGVILMQQSEGGGLGMGGSPSGLMSARGAADFMTRTTTILATMFVLLSISLAFVAARQGASTGIDQTLKRNEAPAVPATSAPATAAPETTAPANNKAVAPAEVPLDK